VFIITSCILIHHFIIKVLVKSKIEKTIFYFVIMDGKMPERVAIKKPAEAGFENNIKNK